MWQSLRLSRRRSRITDDARHRIVAAWPWPSGAAYSGPCASVVQTRPSGGEGDPAVPVIVTRLGRTGSYSLSINSRCMRWLMGASSSQAGGTENGRQ